MVTKLYKFAINALNQMVFGSYNSGRLFVDNAWNRGVPLDQLEYKILEQSNWMMYGLQGLTHVMFIKGMWSRYHEIENS